MSSENAVSPSSTRVDSTELADANRSNLGSPGESQDSAILVQDLLEQMQSRFTEMGNSVIGRMDELGSRMDELENSISQIMDEVGIDQSNSVGRVAIDGPGSNSAASEKIDQHVVL